MKYIIAVVVLLVGCISALIWFDHTAAAPAGGTLTIYCGAGLRKPVEAVADMYKKEFGVTANLQYGGSGALLSNIRASKTGDLFIAADNATMDDARKFQVVREVILIARQRPVIAVHKGNPKSIKTLDDLLRPGIRFAICDESASIGKVTRKALAGRYEEFRSHATVTKPTVTDIATDATIGAVDAAVVWDSTLPQFTALAGVELPDMAKFEETVSIAVLASCQQPAAALRFARYLAAPQKGGPAISRAGLRPVAGDAWSPRPKMVF
jgi:molybdate transport system substrate-binding protein